MTKDLRKYARQTNTQLLIGFFVLLMLVGVGSIYFIYGREAAVFGLVCIATALVPAGLVWLVLALMGWAAKKADGG